MKVKSENGIVTFVMRAGKDKVKSKMLIGRALQIINASENVVEKKNEIIVDDKYFFPAEKEKPIKENDEVTDDE